jgi:hypothetical protein
MSDGRHYFIDSELVPFKSVPKPSPLEDSIARSLCWNEGQTPQSRTSSSSASGESLDVSAFVFGELFAAFNTVKTGEKDVDAGQLGGGMLSPLERKFLRVLSQIASHEKAVPFLHPFDSIPLPNYGKLVPNQLDLCTIASRVLARVYAPSSNQTLGVTARSPSQSDPVAKVIAQFQDDLFDVFLNAALYHQVGTQLCGDALVLTQYTAEALVRHELPLLHSYVLPPSANQAEGGSGGNSRKRRRATLAAEKSQSQLFLEATLLSCIQSLRRHAGESTNGSSSSLAPGRVPSPYGTLFPIKGADMLFDRLPRSLDRLAGDVVSGKFCYGGYASFVRVVDAMLVSFMATNPSLPQRIQAAQLRADLDNVLSEGINVVAKEFLDSAGKKSKALPFVVSSSTFHEGLWRRERREDLWRESRLETDAFKSMPTSESQPMLGVVMSLIALDTTRLFTYPVLSALYIDKILLPMDFSTVKYKLIRGLYRNCGEVLQDLELMYDNCLQFNGPASEYTKEIARIRIQLADLLQGVGLL